MAWIPVSYLPLNMLIFNPRIPVVLPSSIFLILVLTLPIMSTSLHCTHSGPVTPTNPLVVFLEQVLETALSTFGSNNFDPKFYVDLSLKYDLATTQKVFRELPVRGNGNVSAQDLNSFIHNYFNSAGDDLVYVRPVDFVPEPNGFLPKVKNQQVRAWALEVHALWKNLSRKASDSVHKEPGKHTLIPLPEPGMIAGSRFREVYYWDSYWVIRGLLASKMYQTAKSIVTNLIFLIEQYGFVLNGARVYYTNRSQPPMLSSMVHDIYKATGDVNLVKRALPSLRKEYEFWNSGIHKVVIQDSKSCHIGLNRYNAMWNKPRPESLTIDKKSASNLTYMADKQAFYHEVASTAESGWDFSTRWMRNASDFTTLSTTSILPVDLNAFVLKMEIDIAFLAKATGEHSIAKRFLEASWAREKAFNSIFWNEKMGQWLDCWIHPSSKDACSTSAEAWQQNPNVYASNFVPLWIESFNSGHVTEKVMGSLKASGLLQAAGIATSLTDSGQQWDFPNGWAPIQHMIIEGLAKSGNAGARSLAEDIAIRWIRTNYISYKKRGVMHEKYDVTKCGEYGSGGEYIAQTGFGWTNGVVLALLEEFGWPEERMLDCI